MTQKSVNEACHTNKEFKPKVNAKEWTEKPPEKEFFGSKRHFFGRPI